MKLTILLLSVSLAFLTSCTTSYKTGQTPDDVYYSPVRTVENYVREDKDEEETRYNDEYYEDRYLRMKVRNRNRWSDLDDWYYSDYRNRYNVYLGCCYCSSNWSPYSQWNTYHNPYYQNYVIIKNVKSPVYNKPRTFNLNSYNTQQGTTSNSNIKINPGTSNNTYTPRTNNNNNSGNKLRNIFRSSNSSSTTTTPSSSSSSSSSGSSGGSKSGSSGSAPVRRF